MGGAKVDEAVSLDEKGTEVGLTCTQPDTNPDTCIPADNGCDNPHLPCCGTNNQCVDKEKLGKQLQKKKEKEQKDAEEKARRDLYLKEKREEEEAEKERLMNTKGKCGCTFHSDIVGKEMPYTPCESSTELACQSS